ncbi:hypothetical protein HDU79_003079 [Rhizoclosmatium sp. JEL0117]|nr:hypothetical protein HDU79_003079 [Rhizoclosmatium sp. JEL0117]
MPDYFQAQRVSNSERMEIKKSSFVQQSRMCKIDERSARVVWVGNLPPMVDDRAIRAFFLSVGAFDITALNHIKKNQTVFIQLGSSLQVPEFIRLFNGCFFADHQILCSAGNPPHISSSTKQAPTPVYVPSPVILVPLEIQQQDLYPQTVNIPDRFFIMKSFTEKDIQISQKRNMWSTLPRNEEKLNDAFAGPCNNVFLIFSVNGSGGFSGFARMEASAGSGLLEVDVADCADETRDAEGRRLWDSPFLVKWLVTRFVSFRECDHLINTWNDNKPVRVSRDATEIEPSVGYQLLDILANA